MFRIEALPAAHGDCLWIEYGSGATVHRILIDGGPAHSYPALRERLLHLPADDRTFELLIVTHIDADHIEGIVRLLQDAQALNCRFRRIWFNGRDPLNRVPDPTGRPLGALQGEYLSFLIGDYEKRTNARVWNTDFDHGFVAIDRSAGRLPFADLPDDCRLTLLSPDHDRLLELKDRWSRELDKAGVVSGDERQLRRRLDENRQLRPLGDVLGTEDEEMEDRYEWPTADDRDSAIDPEDALGGGAGEPGDGADFGCDASVANGSSIAVLLDYPKDEPEVRFLLAGDAWPDVLETSIELLLARPDGRLRLHGFKIPHHGSVGNLSGSLLRKIACKHYLISTSGAVFRHPHARAIDLLLSEHGHRANPRLHFNYLTLTTDPWNDESRQKNEDFSSFFPKGLSVGI